MGILNWLGLTADAHQTGILTPWSSDSHLAQITLEHLLDLAEPAPITRTSAMRIPAIARGRNLICGQIGRVPWESRTGTTTTDTPWLRHPENRAASLTWTWTADAMLFYGRAWWIIRERDHAGLPSRFQWVPEHAVTITNNQVTVYNTPTPPEDLVRIDGPHEGLLVTAQDTLKAAAATHRAYARTAFNPVPAVELHQTGGDRMTPAEIDELIARWIAARQGANGGVAFTSRQVEAKVHGAPVEQLLIQGRKAITLEVAQHMNLPAWAVDAEVSGSSLTYSNVPSRHRELLDITLQPYLAAIAGRLSMDDVLPHGTRAHPLTLALTTPDFADRMAGYQAALASNVYTLDQLRQMELQTERHPA